jgi:acylphosphatase
MDNEDDPGGSGPDHAAGTARIVAEVSGMVQGVGFRAWTVRRGRALGLAGWARNLPDGRVEVVAEGPEDCCRALVDALRGPGAPGRVDDVRVRPAPPGGAERGFTTR